MFNLKAKYNFKNQYKSFQKWMTDIGLLVNISV